MPDLTEAERQAYAILPTLVREDEYKAKLDELVKRRQEADEAEKNLQEERERLEKVKEDTSLHVAQQTEVLNTAQAEHDASARESAKRIALLNEHSKNLDAREAVVTKKESDLTEHELKVRAHEQELIEAHQKLVARTEKVNGVLKLVDDLRALAGEAAATATQISKALG